MQAEIEIRFVGANHDTLREKLEKLGAKLEQPMRLMKRTIIDYPDRRNQFGNKDYWSWIRVRDEGDRTTLTYKQVAKTPGLETHEIELEVSSYEKMVAVFEAIGLQVHSIQETKRETWTLQDCEVLLDEWPWLAPMVEIEGPNEAALRRVAEALGFNWRDAKQGNVVDVYRQAYPGLGGEEISSTPELSFRKKPDWVAARQPA